MTDQPISAITVVTPSGAPLGVRVEGAERSASFERARQRLGGLVERIETDGSLDPDAPISVTVYLDENLDVGRTVTWPNGVPAPTLVDEHDIQYPRFDGAAGRTVRALLGSSPRATGVRLPDGTVAVATYTAILQGS